VRIKSPAQPIIADSNLIFCFFWRFRHGSRNGASNTLERPTAIAPVSEVIVLIVAVELSADEPSVRVEASNEQLVYSPAVMGLQVSATGPLKPFAGVKSNVYVAGDPLATVAAAALAPFTVRINEPAIRPLPLSGIVAGPLGSELDTVSVADRAPIAEGVKVTVSVQP
jgi:hypothetical protein